MLNSGGDAAAATSAAAAAAAILGASCSSSSSQPSSSFHHQMQMNIVGCLTATTTTQPYTTTQNNIIPSSALPLPLSHSHSSGLSSLPPPSSSLPTPPAPTTVTTTTTTTTTTAIPQSPQSASASAAVATAAATAAMMLNVATQSSQTVGHNQSQVQAQVQTQSQTHSQSQAAAINLNLHSHQQQQQQQSLHQIRSQQHQQHQRQQQQQQQQHHQQQQQHQQQTAQQNIGTAFIPPPFNIQQMSMQQQMRMITAQRAAAAAAAAATAAATPTMPYQQQQQQQQHQATSASTDLSAQNLTQFNRNYYDYSTPMIQQQVQCIQNQMGGGRLMMENPHTLSMPHGFTNAQPNTSAPSSSHHATASANDPCAQIAHVLQCYQQGGEDAEFVRKAIESLVKKLKDKRTELENLITAVTSGGKQPTSCVTIQRSLDGRLQVAGRKGVPHVVYARIWRWPNVSKNELQKLPICAVTPDNQDVICINPYHYERIVSSGIGNIDMSTLRLDSLACASTSSSAHSNAAMVAASMHNTPQLTHAHPSSTPLSSANVCTDQSQQHSYTDVSSQSSSGVALMRQPPDGHHPVNQWIAQGGCAVAASTANPIYQQAQGAYPLREACRNFPMRSPRYDLNAVVLPPTSPPDHWCSISYYELDTQIGETFKVRKDQSEVIIDGGVNPAGAKLGRFCLGALPNVHRCEASEKARLHIGKGVRISTQRDGSVYLECLSHKSVFVRSYYLDFEHNIEYGMTVHKFCSGAPNRKIFDLRWAYAEMEQQSESARFAVVAQAAAVAGYASAPSLTPSLIEHAGTGVDDLRRVCCTIAISFVKGWGSGYNRTSIKETPCWVELQLHRPLQLLDQLLKKNEYYGCD